MRVLACVAACAVLTLAGCEYSPDTVTRSTSYNTAVAEATNQILLHNIVRAAQRQPRYFTRLGSNSASTTITPNIGLSLPFSGIGNGGGAAGGQSSVQNVLTLDNLDDATYQGGALKQFSVAAVGHFWYEGLQPDALGLLLFNAIQIPVAELPALKDTLDKFCAEHGKTQIFCGTEASLVAAQGLTGRFDPANCWNPDQVAIRYQNRTNYAVYINDPALENLDGARHPELCFQIVLRALLALGLHPEGDTDFALDTEPAVHIVQHPAFQEGVLHCTDPEKRDVHCLRQIQHALKTKAIAVKAPQPPELADLEIRISLRSFEGVIYYLGDVVRSQGGAEAVGTSARPYMLAVLGRQPWGEPRSIYEEQFFVLQRGAETARPDMATTDDRGSVYWMPPVCLADSPSRPQALDAARNCSVEFPDHESLAVLSLVNLLWGLEKYPSPTTTIKTIAVGG